MRGRELEMGKGKGGISVPTVPTAARVFPGLRLIADMVFLFFLFLKALGFGFLSGRSLQILCDNLARDIDLKTKSLLMSLFLLFFDD